MPRTVQQERERWLAWKRRQPWCEVCRERTWAVITLRLNMRRCMACWMASLRPGTAEAAGWSRRTQIRDTTEG